ncbi:mannose-1-phosphate guanylyltransferase / mannose-6-phosphate isomerase [Tistlia consotensis]|uniref:mannose-1-phosphate guanylyltransferase n=1 Tax=Tistlia consotensis USBA 355 TaxID=560819 RepID=A0A1Y6CM21_9PROT|nr:mannose-1-phosphate guanylyltransferase/mannose-6-phosphate isomerase [Tistlia consotensis]SMF59156.1 mannose-1-phosphate guanylyltransferase / mannose-6-phosphate isomerase [Tistlia consotensis USBA 355]SNR64190.1 mannose-1-phosphate guanylyltransferase / mannose-6-phosphate isomerase [Tistlia consotensis]
MRDTQSLNAVDVSALETAEAPRRLWPVLLSGGAGTRLWPLSRKHYPKQLQALLSDRTMLQETVLRTRDLAGVAPPLVVCHQEQRFLVTEQLAAVGLAPQRIVLEPSGRNTAPALVVSALLLAGEDPQGLLLAQPADHHIADPEAFRAAVAQAARAARDGWLVTFGVRPTRPETGYGYIQAGAAIDGFEGVRAVLSFVEKPEAATAARLAGSPGCYWNSGVFLLPVGPFLDEVRRLQPDLLAACERAIAEGREDLEFFRLDAEAFESAPALPIDKAIMELSGRVAVVPVEMGWRDVGSWPVLHEALRTLRPTESDGNVFEGDVEAESVRNCHIRADGRLVAALGVEDLTIVVTDDAVLVARTDEAARVGALVERLGRRNRQEVLHHSTVYRPWGSYQSVDSGERFQVKRIVVKPGAELSLQMHHHRAEHWIVVRGTARVHCDGDERLLHENQSTYIPPGTTHRLSNPGILPLHLIEVQSGSYLGEDDIVRFQDSYGRS